MHTIKTFARCNKLLLLVTAMLLNVFFSTAQKKKQEPKPLTKEQVKSQKQDANALFALSSYDLAIKPYLDLYKSDPKNVDVNFRLGYCYLMTDVDKSQAAKYLQYAADNDTKKKEILYYLGLAYHYNNDFDNAVKYYNEYKNQAHNKLIKDFLNADRQIEMCMNGKELVSKPVNVSFENLGKLVNSPLMDYNPFVSADGNTLIFSSRRKGSMGGVDEEIMTYGADIYWTQWKDSGGWSKAKNTGAAVNQQYDEECVWLNTAGDAMIIYMDNMDAFGDIGLCRLKGKTWQRPDMFPAPINTKAFETGATISPDGKLMIMVSDRKEGSQGGRDLYMCTRSNPNDEWGAPKNMGKDINTKYNEDSPFLWMDGKTLYFASEGHNSMGGSDLFKTVYDAASGKWSDPVNLGYPINTTDDDNSISITGDGRTAFVTQVRPGGMGNKDIYKMTFKDTLDHPFLSVFKGTILNDRGVHSPVNKAILINKTDQSIAFDYAPSTGSNVFIMAVRPGSYTLHLEGSNFDPYNEDIVVDDKGLTKQIKVHSNDKASK